MGTEHSDLKDINGTSGAEQVTAFEAPHPGVRRGRRQRRGAWSPLTNGIIIACLAGIVFCALYAAATSSQVGPVHSWHTVQGPGDMFTIQVPAGWQTSYPADSSNALNLVIRRSRWVYAFIEVYPDLAGQVSMWGGGASYDVLAYMHRLTGKILQRQLPEVYEGRAVPTVLGGRAAIWSQIQFNDKFNSRGEQMTGIRVTLADGAAGVLLVAVAPTESWPEFEPVALQMFRSIHFSR